MAMRHLWLSLCAGLLAWSAVGAQGSGSRQVSVNIESQPVRAALQKFGEQTGLQVLMRLQGKAADDFKVPAVSGDLTVREALQKLLANSGLQFEFVNDRTIRISPTRGNTRTTSSARDAGANEGTILAQVGHGAMQEVESEGRRDAGSPSAQDAQSVPEILVKGSRVLNMDVKRSRDDAQAYYIFDSRDIEESGASDLQEFIKLRLSMETGGATSSQTQGNGNLSRINLRGLGDTKTLILVNGRRRAGVSLANAERQPDINGIPLSSIERIEVLPTSASGIYGGSAVGGVVNIILKADYRGLDVRADYRSPVDVHVPARTLSATYGDSFDEGRTTLTLNAQYSDEELLRLGDRRELMDRALANMQQFGASLGGLYTSERPFWGATPNIASVTVFDPFTFLPMQPELTFDADGTSIGSVFTHIPSGLAPNATATQLRNALAAGANSYNLELPDTIQGNTGLRVPYGVAPRVKSFGAMLRRELTPGATVFVELSNNSNGSRSEVNPYTFEAIIPADTTIYLADPSTGVDRNPFAQDLTMTLPNSVVAPNDTESETRSAAIGAIFKLPAGWMAEADYTWSRNTMEGFQATSVDWDGFYQDLAAGIVNPFSDTLRNPQTLGSYVAMSSSEYAGTLHDISLRGAGPVARLPWGAPVLTVGLEHREEIREEGTSVTDFPIGDLQDQIVTSFEQSQDVDSIYAELGIPLVTSVNARPLLQSLELRMATRSERYTVSTGTRAYLQFPNNPAANTYNGPTRNGQPYHDEVKYTANSPMVALKYEPVADWTMRASYQEGFVPPTYLQLLASTVLVTPALVNDPLDASPLPYSVPTHGGGNPDLKPVNSESWGAGVIWQPTFAALEGLRFGADYTRIRQFDEIGQLSAQQIVNLESIFPGRVTRDPVTSRITHVDRSLFNLTRRDFEAWDFSLDYSRDTASGTFRARAAGTVIEHEKRQATLGSPQLEYAGYVGDGGPVKLKTNATLSWERREWTLGWNFTYFDAYKIQGATGSPTAGSNFLGITYQGGEGVPSQSYHDLFIRYVFDNRQNGASSARMSQILEGTRIQFGVSNVFNTLPPYDYTSLAIGYYSGFGDPGLRRYALSVSKQF